MAKKEYYGLPHPGRPKKYRLNYVEVIKWITPLKELTNLEKVVLYRALIESQIYPNRLFTVAEMAKILDMERGNCGKVLASLRKKSYLWYFEAQETEPAHWAPGLKVLNWFNNVNGYHWLL